MEVAPAANEALAENRTLANVVGVLQGVILRGLVDV
jgi:hypothetical protein